MKYNQELPKEVEAQLDAYIERIKNISWFKPSKDLKIEDVKKQVNLFLDALGVKAKFSWKKLQTPNDWDDARNAAWGVARDDVWYAAWDDAQYVARDDVWYAALGDARDDARYAARYAAWDAAWHTACDAARNSARNAALGAARNSARNAALGVALGAARGAADILALNLQDYKKKYPNGNFINLIPLWEMGLYPVGVVDGEFIVYIPPCEQVFPDEVNKE